MPCAMNTRILDYLPSGESRHDRDTVSRPGVVPESEFAKYAANYSHESIAALFRGAQKSEQKFRGISFFLMEYIARRCVIKPTAWPSFISAKVSCILICLVTLASTSVTRSLEHEILCENEIWRKKERKRERKMEFSFELISEVSNERESLQMPRKDNGRFSTW